MRRGAGAGRLASLAPHECPTALRPVPLQRCSPRQPRAHPSTPPTTPPRPRSMAEADGLCSLRLREPCEWEQTLYAAATAVEPLPLTAVLSLNETLDAREMVQVRRGRAGVGLRAAALLPCSLHQRGWAPPVTAAPPPPHPDATAAEPQRRFSCPSRPESSPHARSPPDSPTSSHPPPPQETIEAANAAAQAAANAFGDGTYSGAWAA